MPDGSETVEQIADEMIRMADEGYYAIDSTDWASGLSRSDAVEFADRLVDAHKRETDAYELQIDRWFHQGLKDSAEVKALRTKNEKLRKLVKELADALESEARLKCAMCDTKRRVTDCDEIKGFCSVCDMNALVARAREEVKDGE